MSGASSRRKGNRAELAVVSTLDWRRETMSDLASDSPYYHELRERCPDCGGPIGFSVCSGDRADLLDDYYDDDQEDEDDE